MVIQYIPQELHNRTRHVDTSRNCQMAVAFVAVGNANSLDLIWIYLSPLTTKGRSLILAKLLDPVPKQRKHEF
jgi:hypothetical protein